MSFVFQISTNATPKSVAKILEFARSEGYGGIAKINIGRCLTNGRPPMFLLLWLVGIVTILLSNTSSFAQSAAQLCKEGLVANVTIEEMTRDERFDFANTTNEENYSARKEKLNLIIPEIGSLDWKSAKNEIKKYLKSEQYKSSVEVSWSRLSSTVPDQARRNFFECLRNASNAPFYIAITDETDDSATFQINYRPRGGKSAKVRKSYVEGGYVPYESGKNTTAMFIPKGTTINANVERDVVVFRKKKGLPLTVFLELDDESSSVAYSRIKPVDNVLDVSSLLGNCTVTQTPLQGYPPGTVSWTQEGKSLVGRTGVDGLINDIRVCKIIFPDGMLATKVTLRFGGANGELDYKSNPKANWGTSHFAWIYLFENTPTANLNVWSQPGFIPAPDWSIELKANRGICQCDVSPEVRSIPFSKPRNDVTIVLQLHDPWRGQREIVTVPYFTIEPVAQ